MPSFPHKLVALCVAATFVSGCGKKQQGPPQQQAMPVMVQTVALQNVNDYTDYVGTIQARGATVVQSLVEGYLVKIYVHSGQRVKEGEPLMLVDPRKQEATVRNAQSTVEQQKAQVELAKVNLERSRTLFQAGVVARQDLDNAEAAYNSAVANLNALEANVHEEKTQLLYYEINAATAGTVGDIPVRVGDHVTNTTLLTTLDTGAGLEDYINIPTERAGVVRVGTPVQLVADDGSMVDSKITFVSPRVDTTNQLLLVKAAVPSGDPRFRNNQVVHTRVVWNTKQAVLIPVLDVSRQSSAIFAFVVGKNEKGQDVAEQRAIQTSGVQGNDYVVQSGVKPGEQLITTAVQLLANGVPVKPMPAPAQPQRAETASNFPVNNSPNRGVGQSSRSGARTNGVNPTPQQQGSR